MESVSESGEVDCDCMIDLGIFPNDIESLRLDIQVDSSGKEPVW